MLTAKEAFSSTLGRKFLTAITGFLMILYLVLHLAGNLSIFSSHPGTFNAYANALHKLGPLLTVIEWALLILFVVHIVIALGLRWRAYRSRPLKYAEYHSKDGPSKMGFASTRLLISGVIIGIFVVAHVLQFRQGPGIHQGYAESVGGVPIRDLRRLVVETFHHPGWVVFYVFCLVFLGFHLMHDF